MKPQAIGAKTTGPAPTNVSVVINDETGASPEPLKLLRDFVATDKPMILLHSELAGAERLADVSGNRLAG